MLSKRAIFSDLGKYTMDTSVVDIYGHIADNSEVILGVGNYNNVHGLLTYLSSEDLLQMRPLGEVITPAVISLILTYEKPSHVINRVYFSLAVKGTSKYINIDINNSVACACVSSNKSIFWVDYSSVDTVPRSQLLAGALYSLQTTFEEQEYVVSWQIQGFSNGDLVIFLPTTWYEQSNDFCAIKNGTFILVESLHQIGFKGYTTQQWCETVPKITHCSGDKQCGDCLGPCPDPKHICYPDLNARGSVNKFICGPPSLEPKLVEGPLVTFNETAPTMNGTIATWIAIIVIVIIVALLTWATANQTIYS